MTQSYRIRTKTGVDQNIRINVNQDFDLLEILSLKIRQEDVYTRFCADYGVVVGRVITNGGYGIPNANVSIFVPLSDLDLNDPVISTLYPYRTLDQKNEDGYRYNLLPYVKEYTGHAPTGTFPSREDTLTRTEVLEIYEKYYKYTVKTNDSGDFMIMGVPLGNQKIVLDLDLSNMGCFSLRPADLIRMNRGTAEQFDGQRFKSSQDLASLPQLINAAKDIDVTPFWGEEEICNIGITRVDFDLRDYNIEIKPQATFMGSIFSSSEEDFMRTNCKPKNNVGNQCDLVSGPGKILAIRQKVEYDVDGRPILEQYNLENGGNVIDDDGTWLVEVPMNLDYVTTNEFGEQVLSADPTVGVPTKGRYRFRVQYQNEGGISNQIQRADYLVPNVKEWGWDSDETPDSGPPPIDPNVLLENYAFSLDWNDYGDTGTTMGLAMIQEAINCEDRFYEFNYNKVYTVSSFIDRWKWGSSRAKHLGIKEITERSCNASTNKFPVNDGVRNFDFIFFLFNILLTVSSLIIYPLLVIMHVLALIYPILKKIIDFFIGLINLFYDFLCDISDIKIAGWYPFEKWKKYCDKPDIPKLSDENPFKRLSFPMMSYPDCEACACESEDLNATQTEYDTVASQIISAANTSILADTNTNATYTFDIYKETGLTTQYNEDSYNAAAAQLFSGYQKGSDPLRNKYSKLPIVEVPNQTEDSSLYLGADVTLSQSLNLANLRTRFFDTDAPNLIKTTVKNTIPNTLTEVASDDILDTVMVLFCEPSTTLQSGQLITFNDPTQISDPNYSAATPNQFNTSSITGTTSFNQTSLVNKTITTLDTNGNILTKTLKLKITENGKDYKFKSGIEYFQVITGDTYGTYKKMTTSATTATNDWVGLLDKYLFMKKQRAVFCVDPINSDCTSQYQKVVFVKSAEQINEVDGYKIYFLVRGVDPYTQKQTIQYDLSRLFGYGTFGNGPVIKGEYYLNIPIQPSSGPTTWWNDFRTPQTHQIGTNNSLYLFHKSFSFTPDTTKFTAFTNNSIKYYNSTDKSRSTHKAYDDDTFTLGSPLLTDGDGVSVKPKKLAFQNSGTSWINQGIIEGGSAQISGLVPNSNTVGAGINPIETGTGVSPFARTFSPAYHIDFTPNFTMTESDRIVFRSDRLPTSDKTEVEGNTSFSLHLNNNFGFYLIDDAGVATTLVGVSMGVTDTSSNYENLIDDQNQFADVLDTLSCAKMVPLKCYQGSGLNIMVNDDCEENKMGKNDENKRIVGGCYYFVDNPLLKSLGDDFKAFEEWKSRFRMQFAACRGVIGHVFQNNWVNGSLYMFSFKNAKRFTILGDLKRYKYCGDPLSYRPNQGPLIFTFGTTNSFFYRSTPYNFENDEFVGQYPKKKSIQNVWESAGNDEEGYKGMNEKNIFFPTTLMDLGPRDEFTKEICFNPQFEGYLVDTLRSTSFNDGGDVLQLFIFSRLLNSNFWEQALGLGDGSINKLFSRSEDRIDGDFAQSISVNSEYGVDGFNSDDYEDASVYVENAGGDALFGIFFSSDTPTRQILTPGKLSYTTFGYPKTQVVPMYKWKSDNQTNIFGSEKNNWYTGGAFFYKQPYQTMDFTQSDYFKPENGEKLGYIYNRDSSLNVTTNWPNGQNPSYVVGAPFHFYFGLGKGKSAMNRYITKYIFNQ